MSKCFVFGFKKKLLNPTLKALPQKRSRPRRTSSQTPYACATLEFSKRTWRVMRVKVFLIPVLVNDPIVIVVVMVGQGFKAGGKI